MQFLFAKHLYMLYFFFFLKVSEITDDLATLPKRAQLAAAFITYLSAAPEDQRKNSLDEWTKSAGLESNFVCVFVSVCMKVIKLDWGSEK